MNGPTARAIKELKLTPPECKKLHLFWNEVKEGAELQMAAYDLLERSARDKAKEFPDAPYV